MRSAPRACIESVTVRCMPLRAPLRPPRRPPLRQNRNAVPACPRTSIDLCRIPPCTLFRLNLQAFPASLCLRSWANEPGVHASGIPPSSILARSPWGSGRSAPCCYARTLYDTTHTVRGGRHALLVWRRARPALLPWRAARKTMRRDLLPRPAAAREQVARQTIRHRLMVSDRSLCRRIRRASSCRGASASARDVEEQNVSAGI